MKSFPKRTILVLGFGLALGIQLVIGALSYRNTTRLIAASDQVCHSQEVLHRLEDVDRKSTRLNSSHGYISYAVFCLKKKKKNRKQNKLVYNKKHDDVETVLS